MQNTTRMLPSRGFSIILLYSCYSKRGGFSARGKRGGGERKMVLPDRIGIVKPSHFFGLSHSTGSSWILYQMVCKTLDMCLFSPNVAPRAPGRSCFKCWFGTEVYSSFGLPSRFKGTLGKINLFFY
uniref:Uncharacterized protein n=1 Tax=Sphaerodactylus townsendi TaxID=933632 RepID=A0ACB8E4A9_9SAUR